jgi:hypothetical protein
MNTHIFKPQLLASSVTAILLSTLLLGGCTKKDQEAAVIPDTSNLVKDTALKIIVTDAAGSPVKSAKLEVITDEADIIPAMQETKVANGKIVGLVGYNLNYFSEMKQTIQVRVTKDGYTTNNVPVTVYKDKSNSKNIVITKKANNVAGINSASVSGDASLGDIALNVAGKSPEEGNITVVIPQGSGATTAEGKLLSNNLKMDVVQFDANSDAALAAFPGGFSVRIENPDGVRRDKVVATDHVPVTNGEIIFQSAGFTAIEISDDQGNVAKNFQRPLQISTKVMTDFVNPQTKKLIKEGDIIPIWSFNETSGKWKYDQKAAVIKDGSGGLKVDYNVSHLSYWNLDFYSISTCSSTITVTGDASGMPLKGTISGTDSNGDGFIKSITYDGSGVIEIDNAPGSYDVTLKLETLSGKPINVSPDTFNLCDNSPNNIVVTVPQQSTGYTNYDVNITVIAECSNVAGEKAIEGMYVHVNAYPVSSAYDESKQTDVNGKVSYTLTEGEYLIYIQNGVDSNGHPTYITKYIKIPSSYTSGNIELRIPQVCYIPPSGGTGGTGGTGATGATGATGSNSSNMSNAGNGN